MEFSFAKVVDGIDDLDSVPQEFQPLFAQDKDGKYKVNESFKDVAMSIDGLNRALAASRADVKKAKSTSIDLSPLKEYGDSPADIAKAFSEKLADAVSGAKADQKGALLKYQADFDKKLQAEKEPLIQERDRYKSELYRTLVSNTITGALAAEKAIIPLLQPVVASMVRVVEEDVRDRSGATVKSARVMVVDDSGEERMSLATGKGMTVQELARELKGRPEFAPAFASDVAAGSGGKRPSHVQPTHGQAKTSEQKIASGLRSRGVTAP